jgi:hypothetical protein
MAEKKSDVDAGGVIALVALAVIALLLVLPVLLAGYVLYAVLRDHLGRREAWALLTSGAVTLVVAGAYTVDSYVAFVAAVVAAATGSGPWTDALAATPALVMVAGGAVVAGLMALLARTRLGSRFGRILPQHTKVRRRGLLGVKHVDVDEDALLDAQVRQEVIARSKVVAPPGGGLVVDPTEHSAVAPAPVGKRRFPIGLDAQGTPVYLSEAEVRTHGLLLGATGSGKSETIKVLAGGLLDLGWSGMLVDLKEDTAPGGLRDWCFDYAVAHGTPYQELRLSDPNSPTWFNVLSGMGPDEARDAILSLQQFEAAYYEALNKELLGQLINLMYWAHQVDPTRFAYPTMYDVAKICGSPSLAAATKAMRAVVLEAIPGLTTKDFHVLSNPPQDQAKAAAGFGARLGNIFDSQAGRIVLRNNAEGTRQEVDVTAEGLTYIGLDSQGKPDLTRVTSSSILQRLSVYASQRTVGSAGKSQPRFVIVDEANWVNREIVKNLLSRARSAGIALFLATQGPTDWIDRDGDDWTTLTQNMNIAVIMRQGAPQAAELCAEYFGKKVKQKVSERVEQTSGLFGDRRVRDAHGRLVESFTVSEDLDYRVPPDTLRELTVGEAFLRVGSPEQRTQYIRVQMRDPKAMPRR